MEKIYDREDGGTVLPFIQLNRSTYPLYVGGNAVGNGGDKVGKGSSFLLEAILVSKKYGASDIVWEIEDPAIVGFDTEEKEKDAGFGWRRNEENRTRDCRVERVAVRVRALRTGVAKVRAVLPDGSSAECIFTVIDFFTRLTAADMVLNTEKLWLPEGASARLFPILYPKDIYGNCRLNPAVTWSSSDEKVAVVDKGIVTAVGSGMAEITVCSVDVGRKAVCRVTVGTAVKKNAGETEQARNGSRTAGKFPVPVSIEIGEKLELSAPVGLGGMISWVSENRYVADVDENGIVTGLSASLGQRVDASGLEIMEIPQPVWIYATDVMGGRTIKYPLYVKKDKLPVMGLSIAAESSASVGGTGEALVVPVGESRILTAAVCPSAHRETEVTWGIEECGTGEEPVIGCMPLQPAVTGAARAQIWGYRSGEAMVTASFEGRTVRYGVHVTEERRRVREIELPAHLEISVDQVYRFEPLLTEDAVNQRLYWIVSDYGKATLDREGNLQGYHPGSCRVYAIAEDSLTEEQCTYLSMLGTNAEAPEERDEFQKILKTACFGVCEVEVKEESVCLRNLHVVEESVTEESVLLLWNRSSLIDAAELEEYHIYRDGKWMDVTQKLGYRAEGLEPEQRYHFMVEAIGKGGEVLARQDVYAKTTAASPVMNVLEYGVKGDGKCLETCFIQRAIDECPMGGTVLLPAGHIFVSGALFLKSNMTFCVDGILIGSIDPKDYPRVISRWEGWRKLDQPSAAWDNTSAKVPDSHCSHASLLNAGCYDEGERGCTGPYNVENLIICGQGQINANGFTLAYNEGPNINIGKFVGIDTYPVQDASLRGSVIRIHNGRNIYVKDVQLAYAPFWTVHTIFCERITFDGVEVVSMGDGDGGKGSDLFYCGHVFNGDGIDPEHCARVNIFDVFFTTGDDPIAIKSGRNREGNELDKPNAYIRVTDCVSRWSLGGFGTGSESASGSHDLIFQNLDIRDIVLNGIWIKTCRPRGGVTEFIQVRDVSAVNCDSPVWIFNNYSSTSVHANPAKDPPIVRRMVFENIRGSAENKRGIVIDGVEGCPVTDIHFRGVDNGGRQDVIRFGENITGLD